MQVYADNAKKKSTKKGRKPLSRAQSRGRQIPEDEKELLKKRTRSPRGSGKKQRTSNRRRRKKKVASRETYDVTTAEVQARMSQKPLGDDNNKRAIMNTTEESKSSDATAVSQQHLGKEAPVQKSPRHSQVMPSQKINRKPKRSMSAAMRRAQTQTLSEAKHFKTQEDAIANIVLWMALITHIGKMRKNLGISDTARCVLAPNSKFRTYWDSISMMFIMYVIAFTPFQISFLNPPLMETSVSSWAKWGVCEDGEQPCFNYWGIFLMDLIIDLFFTADIVVNFRSAWIDKDPFSPTFKTERYSCKQASIQYLKGMLFIDVLSVLPFWMFDLSPGLIGGGTLLRIPRLLRLAKLLKLLKVLRVSRVFNRWNKAITTTCSSKVVMLVELTVVLLVSVHLMGCAWYLVASMQLGFEEEYAQKYGPADSTTSTTTPNTTVASSYSAPTDWWDGNTWIMRLHGFQQASISEMYLASIYFALTTITTVGYGDITPVIFSERLTCFVCMIMGIILFGYIVGQVTVLIRTLTMRRNQFFEDMSTLQTYLRSYPFSKAMRTRAIDYFYYTYNNDKYHVDNDARRSTIQHFSPYLQRSLAYAEYKHFLVGWTSHDGEMGSLLAHHEPLQFLSKASQHVIKDLCADLECEVYGPVEIVACQGAPCNKMYALDGGCMVKWSNTYDQQSGKAKMMGWQYVTKGERFGTDSLLLFLDCYFHRQENLAKTHIATWFQSFQTLTFCDFICLPAWKFAEVLKRYPKQVKGMHLPIIRAKFRAYFHSILQMTKSALVAAYERIQRDGPGIHSRIKSHIEELHDENAVLKDMVQDLSSKFDRAQKQQQQMQQQMEEQRQTMAKQHQEILSLLKPK